jgi:hypothetical protein
MINLDSLRYVEEDREKKAFYASDFGKSKLDLFFAFTGEKKTNPPQWYETLKWAAGKGVEEAMLKILKTNGHVPGNYDQREHGRIEKEYKNIKIHGYIDAKHVSSIPIEIKSVNNANKWDVSNYKNGYPKENYVGQLGIYMWAEGVDQGLLFVSTIDGLETFIFEAKWIRPGVVQCGNTIVDIFAELDRWNDLWEKHIEPKVMPDIWEYVYKKDIETLDWKKVSASDISKARNGHKVIGDWQIGWSSWKDKIVALQGSTIGYTDKELARIKELTEGYSTWKKDKKEKVES